MGEFFKQLISSSNTPWIVGIITAAVTGIFSLRKVRYEKREENNKLREDKKMESEKLRYEKRLEKFKETNESLFKDKKQEVLAAIATLSIFKRDPEFEKNTIDVLLSRLYTELDYDIINSILTTLIQESDREELLYIADGLQDINRNFFVKESPMNQRISDINTAIKSINRSRKLFEEDAAAYELQEKEKKVEYELFLSNKDNVIKKYNEDFSELFAYQKYRHIWHKQVSADAYATFMRKAYLANKKAELHLKLFQNDFNYVYMAEVKTTSTSIERSAFGNSTFVKVVLDQIHSYRNSFVGSQLFQTSFKNGKMTNTIFSNVKFEDVIFENIEFENCSFNTADFKAATFINCTGLKQEQFDNSLRFDELCQFPEGIVIEHNDDYLQRVTAPATDPAN